MRTYDVIIVGLGGMGSAAASHLARRGLRVLGLERHQPVHALGSSHGGSRIFRTAYFEDPAYVPLLLRAHELWQQLEHDAQETVFTTTGCLIVGGQDRLGVSGSVTSAREWGLPYELFDAAELRRRYPVLAPDDDEVGMLEPSGAIVRPEATVRTNLQAAGRAGADLRFETSVADWNASADGEGVSVRTSAGAFEAGRLVLAPGAWAPQLLGPAGARLEVQRRVQYWIEPSGPIAPFLAPALPTFAWDLGDGGLFYGFPAEDLDGVGAVKVAIHRGIDDPCDPDRVDREVSSAEMDHLRSLLAGRIPALDQPALRTATCLYTDTPDEHFLVGPHPAHPQVTIAAGFSGHGFKFVPVIGELVADLVTGASTTTPALFDPARLLTG
jgi:sarcosine oxidase